MKLILLSPPGGGKGTQSKLLVENYHIPHISTGDIFRKAVEDKTELGKLAQEYMDSGRLVPDEVVVGLVKERLEKDDCAQGFILDGFPRTRAQAKALEEITSIDVAISLEVPDEIVVRRLTDRRSCRECNAIYNIVNKPPKQSGICDRCGGELYHRDDDKEATIRERLRTYTNQTEPLLDYYSKKSKLITVNGDGEIDEIFGEIQVSLQKYA